MSWWERFKHYWTQTGVIPRWQLFAIYGVIIAITIVGWQNAQRQSDEIQKQRVAATHDACVAQNERHDQALRVTFQLMGHPAVPRRPPLTAEQMKAQRRALVIWVSALVPKRDCKKLVNSVVK